MKKFVLLLTGITAFAVLAPVESQARDRHQHHSSQSFSHNCRSCGGPTYRQRVFAGYDRHGHPIYTYRTMTHRCDYRHGRGHHRHGHGHDHHRDYHRSGFRISVPGFHFGF